MATLPPATAEFNGPAAARPPQVFCPSCASPLVYRHTVVRSTGARITHERWDVYACAECGPFELRKAQGSLGGQ